MDGYSISQAAQQTGFPASTLRYYEQTGLLRPERTAAGYRSYSDHHIELLLFIGRAKSFGLSLDEIAELLVMLDGGQCAPIQGRLRHLVDCKIGEAREKAAELDAFASELGRVAQELSNHTPDGPCDDKCGCTTEREASKSDLIHISTKPERGAAPDMACTLVPEGVGDRLAEWKALTDGALRRDPISGGVRVRFARDADIVAISSLIAAEQDCCQFFTFALTIDVDEVILDVTGPADAQSILDVLVGATV